MKDGAALMHWCILRTSGGRTLALAASLAEAGYDVWTPTDVIHRRRPRSRETIEITVPIMPTFVFARKRHLHALAMVRELPISPHPPFSIFRYAGDNTPCVSDSEIAGARAEEAKAKQRSDRAAAKAHRRTFPIGTKVAVKDGAFVGLEGLVEGGDGRFALVTFGGTISLKVATILLTSEELEGGGARAGAKPHTIAA